jgi:hypothetical protein
MVLLSHPLSPNGLARGSPAFATSNRLFGYALPRRTPFLAAVRFVGYLTELPA